MADIRITFRGQNQSGRAFDDVRRDGQRVEQSMEQIGRAAHEASQDVDRAGNRMSQAMGSIEDSGSPIGGMFDGLGGRAGKFGDILKGLGPIGIGAAAVVGTAVAGIGLAIKGAMDAAQASIARTEALSKQKAQLGLTPEEAAKFGKTAGKVYAQNYGESLEEAGNAVRDAARILGSATDPALEATAKKVANLAKVSERDTKEIGFAIHQMLVTGMAGSVDEAFDLLFSAINGGVDGMGDLIDSMGEYNALMQQSGLSAQEMFGLFKQGMDAGAFGTDKIADAIKELRLRVTGGGKAIEDAFKSLGINSENAMKGIGKGGKDGAKFLDLILDKLRELQKVDPTGAAKAIQALFGGPGEDLGQSIFALDPSQAVAALGQIEGAADKADAHLSGSSYAAIEKYKRQWEMFKADVGDKLLPLFERLDGIFQRVGKSLEPLVKEIMPYLKQVIADNSEEIEAFWEVAEPILKLFGAIVIGTVVFAIQRAIETAAEFGGMWIWVKGIFIQITPAVLGFFSMILNAAVNAFGWIPGLGDKLRSAQQRFEDFKNEVNADLAGIKDKTVTVTIERKIRGPSLGGVFGYQGLPTGGMGSGMQLTGEHGPEIVDMNAGRVHNAGSTNRIFERALRGLESSGGGGGGSIHLTVAASQSAGNPLAEAVLQLFRGGHLRFQVEQTGQRVKPA